MNENDNSMLKILSLNLNFYAEKHGKWPDRRHLILQAINEANPDIIALQAVAKDPNIENGRNQATQLYEELFNTYSHLYYEPSQADAGDKQEGAAILSKIRFSDYQSMRLSFINTEDKSRRVLLAARFHLKEGDFYLFNGHFSWVYDQAQVNIKEALPYLNDVNGFALLIGDLNHTPDSNLFDPFKVLGWVDVWDKVHSGKGGYTFESDNPTKRIDYAWANPVLKDKIVGIETIQKENNNIRMSDHLAILVTLDLNP
ncbi:MAG TPA: endonuclease/exonuclease/phosphatase family protein [Cytophagaceae bacterium]